MPRRPEEALFSRAAMSVALARLQEKSGRSQSEAARYAGVSPSEWTEWVKGNRGIELNNLARALRGVNATIHDLADELEGPQEPVLPSVLNLIAELAERNERLRQQVAALGGNPDEHDPPPALSAQDRDVLLRRLTLMMGRLKSRTRAGGGGEGA